MGYSSFNVFSSQRRFSIYDLDEATGFVRIQDPETGYFHDLRADSRQTLSTAKRFPEAFSVLINIKDLSSTKVDKDSKIGLGDISILDCTLINISVIEPPNLNRNMQATANSRQVSDYGSVHYDMSPGLDRKDYDPDDKEARRTEASSRSAISYGPGGINMAGPGGNNLIIDSNGSIGNYSNNITDGPQEKDKAGGMFTTSLNFLQHYFIGIANAVTLPMPHMLNLPKLIATGAFVASISNKIKVLTKGIKSINS